MNRLSTLVLIGAVLLTASCGTYKRLGYLQDMETDINYSMPLQPEAKIAKGDRIKIVVACTTPDLATPFNILNGVSPVDPTTGSKAAALASAGASDSESSLEGFEVDSNGDINYPVLGKIHAEGLTLDQLKDYISEQIIEKRYIKDPVVVAAFTNFKFTVLGEAGTGVYSSPDGKVNMFDVLAMSGDLKESAVRNDIWVVRTVDGKRQLYTINLQTKDCYYSPVFFIQQNDMIYVKPKDTKFDDTVNNRMTVINSIAGVIGTALNAWMWFTYMFKR